MKKTGKKGFTLTELTVVLALVAIVSGMVVSFAAMISARTKLSIARLNAMNDLELVESVTEGWMSRAGTLRVENGVLVDDDGNTLSFDEEEKVLEGTLPDGSEITAALEQVTGVEYTLLENNTGDCLCICTVTLELSSGESENQTICINPYVGDIYGEATPDSEQEGEQDENA